MIDIFHVAKQVWRYTALLFYSIICIYFLISEGIPPNFQNCSLTGNKENIHSHFLENMWGQIEAFEVKTTDQTDSNDEVMNVTGDLK